MVSFPAMVIVVRLGSRTIFKKVLPRAKKWMPHKAKMYMITLSLRIRQSLIKIGVPAKYIRTGFSQTKTHYTQTVTITPNIAVIKSVAKKAPKTMETLASTKAAIIASVGSTIATFGVMKSKSQSKKKKYTLTTKQKATLKKDGHVYITRNKKQIILKR